MDDLNKDNHNHRTSNNQEHVAGDGWPEEIEQILKPIRERLAQIRNEKESK